MGKGHTIDPFETALPFKLGLTPTSDLAALTNMIYRAEPRIYTPDGKEVMRFYNIQTDEGLTTGDDCINAELLEDDKIARALAKSQEWLFFPSGKIEGSEYVRNVNFQDFMTLMRTTYKASLEMYPEEKEHSEMVKQGIAMLKRDAEPYLKETTFSRNAHCGPNPDIRVRGNVDTDETKDMFRQNQLELRLELRTSYRNFMEDYGDGRRLAFSVDYSPISKKSAENIVNAVKEINEESKFRSGLYTEREKGEIGVEVRAYNSEDPDNPYSTAEMLEHAKAIKGYLEKGVERESNSSKEREKNEVSKLAESLKD